METRMLWTLGITLLDHVCNNTVRARMKVAPIVKKMQEKRLRWNGHVPGGRWKKTTGKTKDEMDRIRADLKELRMDEHHALNREYWRQLIRTADPAKMHAKKKEHTLSRLDVNLARE
ncbi:unnamed protein product [Strongylus vulgaris]|uniref:Uncharacterized protein n=1 Tax=Strongylus vulgaris TaxID=40348 RepID=A0A3P7JM94_STRVU|nr:unnamed protein product [Strongylus vulgaris]